jgi:hypothetical protein
VIIMVNGFRNLPITLTWRQGRTIDLG